ncbi:MAG: ATP-binding protein [Bacilli bacterium]|nr:ATP-binding protein [Bacilli bacterium]
MIKSFLVEGLNGSKNYNLNFHKDLNILTGRNGSGKTTLLKLLWYLTSPLRTNVLFEVNFKRAKVVTDKYSLEIERDEKKDEFQISRWKYSIEGAAPSRHEIRLTMDRFHRMDYEKIENLNNKLLDVGDDSLFFPTFRRIEGGYGTSMRRYRSYYGGIRYGGREENSLSEAMEEFAKSLSDSKHKLVASISTNDIVEFLMSEYNSVTEETKRLYVEFSKRVKETLTNKSTSSSSLLKKLKGSLLEVEKEADGLMRPFKILSDLVSEVFIDKGIKVAPSLSLGEAKSVLNSEALSAGEKQMFSFLSYNAFVRNNIIFIDEPELSLHVDWQRMLFSKLLEQETSNQFIVTTHSPFIYTRYPDKEFFLDSDRGCGIETVGLV